MNKRERIKYYLLKWLGGLENSKGTKFDLLRALLPYLEIEYKKLCRVKELYSVWNKNSESWNNYKDIEWKIIRGHYLIEKEYRLDDALNEMKQKIEEWGWININHKVSDVNSNNENDEKVIQDQINPQKNNSSEHKKSSKQIANLIWESIDIYFISYCKISNLFDKLCSIKTNNGVKGSIDWFNTHLKVQEKNMIGTKILSDKNYTPFICNKYNLENSLENSKQLLDLLQIYDRLEYIYLFIWCF